MEWTADDVREMIRAYIKANNMTQTAFADLIGVSLPFVNDILLGKRAPTGKVLSFFKLTRKVVYVK